MVAAACLGDDTITALLEGGLGDEAARGARAHIAGCAACRRLVSAAIDANTSPAPTNPFAQATPRGVAPGSVIAGKYRIERMLGEGGMGRVYAARQTGLERPVALKILRPELARDAVALTRFHREARLIASLNSEHVVRVHDLGALDTGEPYLVMELLEGEDLGTVLARGPIPVHQATALILAACEALAEAHALGIVHRDIKPSNLFLTRTHRLKVLDFGIAKLAAPSAGSLAMTGEGIVLGSPRYMAPEQITGSRDVDARADIWSLGATLYHLVTGSPPFAEPTLEAIFAAILSGHTPPLLGSLPPGVAGVIHRALARDPAARFATVGELAAALRGAPVALEPTVERRVLVPSPGRRRALPVVIVSAVIAAVVVAVVSQQLRSTPRSGAGAGSGSANAVVAERPVDPAARPLRVPVPATPLTGAGPLGNLDESRLQARLEKLGWTIQQITRESFPGCDHTRLLISKDATANADAYLLDCESVAAATSEAARLRRGFPRSWVVTDATLVLIVGLPSEERSRDLANDLINGATGSGPALGPYVACFNQVEPRLRAIRASYKQGTASTVGGIDPIDGYHPGVCAKNLAQAVANGAGPLAGPATTYRDALAALLPIVGETRAYYEHKDYKDDDHAKGKTLHAKLTAAFADWDQASTALRTTWDAQRRARRDPDLAAIEQQQGRASERFVAEQVMTIADQMIEALDDAKALPGTLARYADAFTELTTYFGPALTASTDTDRFTFKQAAEALLVQTKEAARTLRGGSPLPPTGDGSKPSLLEKYNALVENSSSITWDGGDPVLRRLR
jgi:serine/threonine protein kinase